MNLSPTSSWSSLIPTIIAHFAADATSNAITPVPFSTWFSALKASPSRTDDVATNPGIKLPGIFEQMATGSSSGQVVKMETAQMVRKSLAISELKAVEPE